MKIESDQCCEIFFLSTLLLMKDQGSSYGDVSPSIFFGKSGDCSTYKFLMRNHLLLLREETLFHPPGILENSDEIFLVC